MPFYHNLGNNCHVQVFVRNNWIRTTAGEYAWDNGCSPCIAHYCLERTACDIWGFQIDHPPDHERQGLTTCCWFGISCPTDWIIWIIVFLQRQKTQLIRGISSVCPSFSVETARTPHSHPQAYSRLFILHSIFSRTTSSFPVLLLHQPWVKPRDILFYFISFWALDNSNKS